VFEARLIFESSRHFKHAQVSNLFKSGISQTHRPSISSSSDDDENNNKTNNNNNNNNTKVIHQKLAEAAELIEDKSPYYQYTPANVLENENFKLYWNRSKLMDKKIPFNRPDITFMNK
jgi:hypothetical protein